MRDSRRTPVGTALLLGAALVSILGCSAVLDYPDPQRERGPACLDGLDNDLDGLRDDLDPNCMNPRGMTCSVDDDCDYMVCGELTNGTPACTTMCGEGSPACPLGWECDAPSARCTCTPCVERCNTLDDDCDGAIDEDTCAVGESCVEGACSCPGQVFQLSIPQLDVLVVVDNSNSMMEEQAALAEAMARAVSVLVTGDLDADGLPEYPPIASLHIGVVTTDMGVGPDEPVPSCTGGFGDDGILRPASFSCPGAGPERIFAFQAGVDTPMTFGAEVACAVTLGTTGCGFESQLEAPLKALSPARAMVGVSDAYVPPVFTDGTAGHGDGMNADFLRPNSLLAILIVSDEDDCSTADPTLFYPSSPVYSGTPLNLRCHGFPDAVRPVERYVDGFLQLRRNPQSVLVAIIAGVPLMSEGLSFEEILALPEMVESSDPSMPERLTPSCITDRGLAFPPRRLVEVARGIECGGGTASVASICEPSLLPAFGGILRGFYASDARRACVIPER